MKTKTRARARFRARMRAKKECWLTAQDVADIINDAMIGLSRYSFTDLI